MKGCSDLDEGIHASVRRLELEAHYSCNDGFYQMSGDVIRYCKLDLTWSGQPLACSRMYTKHIKHVPLGYYRPQAMANTCSVPHQYGQGQLEDKGDINGHFVLTGTS